jgi:DNA-binding transcriptional regulator PaaX
MRVLKRKLLFVLGHTGGVLQGKSDFDYLGLSEIYWRLPQFAHSSVREALLQMTKKRLASRIQRDGKTYYRMTNVGREYLFRQLRIPRGKRGVWDRGWRMVIVDAGVLSKAEVRGLRTSLKDLGMKTLSRGIWVTPQNISNEIKQLLLDKDLVSGVVVVVTRRFMVGDDKAFAEKVWSLIQLNQVYREFVSQTEQLLTKVRASKSLTNELKSQFNSVFDRWQALIPEEPRLPKALLPESWLFSEAGAVFDKLTTSVLELEREGS